MFEEKKADIDNDKDKNDGNGFVKIFDGTLDGWKMVGKGGFAVVFEGDRQQQQQPCLKLREEWVCYGIAKRGSRTLFSSLNGR